MDFDNSFDIISPDLQPSITIGGTGSLIIPIGTTAQQPTNIVGSIRFNSDNSKFEFGDISGWFNYLINGYSTITDGVSIISSVGSDTLKFRTANNILSVLVTNDELVHGDNILLTINQGNISHTLISDIGTNSHTQIDTFISSKGALDGLATLDGAGKVPNIQLSDVLSVTDLSTYSSISGVGTTAILSTITSPSNNQVLSWSGTDWINQSLSASMSLYSNLDSTGILTGGTLSINVDTTKFNISSGTGIIVDNYTDVVNPVYTPVTWTTFTGITATNLASADRSFIAIDVNGNLIQSAVPFTNTEHKNYIVIGNLGHANRVAITGLRNNPDPAFDATARLADMARALGAFNIEGNVFSPNGSNLLMNKSGGRTYRLGNNFQLTKKDTDTTTDASASPVTFLYSWRNGTGGWNLGTSTSTIIPNLWDNGSGTLQTVPNGRYTIQLIKYFSGINGPIARIEYGQTLYSSLQSGWSQLPDPYAVSNPAFAEGVTRCYLIIAGSTTDLTNTADAIFVEAAKFGVGSGGQFSGSITDLQQAYLNSVNPEITTNSTLGALGIKEGSGVGGNLIEGYNSSNVLNFSVSTAGNIFTNGTVDGRDVSADGIVLDNLVLNAADKVLSRHNGAVTQTFSTTPTLLLFGTNIRTDANYSYSSGVVTINVTSTYEISFDASYATTSSSVTTCQTAIYKNGILLTGSTAHSNHSSTVNGQQTTSGTLIISLVATDTISIVGVRVAGSGSLVSQSNGCRLNITKVR